MTKYFNLLKRFQNVSKHKIKRVLLEEQNKERIFEQYRN